MDTSETYIKMCDCAEIQKLRKGNEDLEIGDYVQVRDFYQPFFIAIIDRKGMTFDSKRPWLPRQDQLQGMSGLNWRDFDELCWRTVWDYGGSEVVCRETTKEQAGIQAVMKEKYNKVWDGEQWLIT